MPPESIIFDADYVLWPGEGMGYVWRGHAANCKAQGSMKMQRIGALLLCSTLNTMKAILARWYRRERPSQL